MKILNLALAGGLSLCAMTSWAMNDNGTSPLQAAAPDTTAMAADSGAEEKTSVFSGSFYTEVNYGHKRFSENRQRWDFPHFVFSAQVNLGSWSLVAEVEYERFFDDGEWQDKFKDCFFKNKLYVNKRFSEAVQAKLGILDVPVALTNAGGPALTIYDPESEAMMLPMSWHEHGVGVWGSVGKWSYALSGLFYMDAPLRRSKALGVAARVDYAASCGLRLGVSGYKGTSSAGMVCYTRPDYVGTDGLTYAAFDFDYQKNGLVIDGSYIYSSDCHAMGYGVEAGYDVMTLFPSAPKNLSVVPLARYDGFNAQGFTTMNKWTVGVNMTLLKGLDMKFQYGSRHNCGQDIDASLDVSVGYTLNF